MKKLIMFVMVFAIATPALALDPQHTPNFSGCDNSAWVIWEFNDDGCLPTSASVDPPYFYNPEPVDEPTFGSRHWDDPTEDAGWGGSYGEGAWTWSDGALTINAEDSFNQSIPHRGEKKYLRQYFQVIHTWPEGGDPCTLGLIGLGLEVWDMSVYEENGWTGCPTGYEGLDGDGYREGFQFTPPAETYDHGDGWYTSIWVSDFSPDDTIETPYAYDYELGAKGEFPDLHEVTHTACIVGMDLDRPTQTFKIDEVVLDFIWFDEPDGSDIPDNPCNPPVGEDPPIDVETVVIYEPQDAGGPAPMGPVTDNVQVKLAWKPGDPTYPNFNCTVVVDPDPNQENVGSADFSITNPVPPDPNGNVTLTFTQANWSTYQNVALTATADLLREGTESFNLEFTITIDIDDPNFGSDEPVILRRGISVADNDIPYISVVPYGGLTDVLTENDPCVSECVNVTLSHLPTSNVDVFVTRASDYDIVLESMSVMIPPLGVGDDPNRLTFTPGNYNSPQTICLQARDDDIRGEGPEEDGLEWIPGQIFLNAFSDDPRYQSAEEGGELEESAISFNVQDNECGAWGYDPLDVNEDCAVNLADFAQFYGQWLECTEPYDDAEVCSKLWELGGEEE